MLDTELHRHCSFQKGPSLPKKRRLFFIQHCQRRGQKSFRAVQATQVLARSILNIVPGLLGEMQEGGDTKARRDAKIMASIDHMHSPSIAQHLETAAKVFMAVRDERDLLLQSAKSIV